MNGFYQDVPPKRLSALALKRRLFFGVLLPEAPFYLRFELKKTQKVSIWGRTVVNAPRRQVGVLVTDSYVHLIPTAQGGATHGKWAYDGLVRSHSRVL